MLNERIDPVYLRQTDSREVSVDVPHGLLPGAAVVMRPHTAAPADQCNTIFGYTLDCRRFLQTKSIFSDAAIEEEPTTMRHTRIARVADAGLWTPNTHLRFKVSISNFVVFACEWVIYLV